MTTRLARQVALAYGAAACFVACGGDDSAPMDGGVVDSGTDGGITVGPLPSGATLEEPALPAPPAPVAWDCPEGWRVGAALTEDGAEVCRPWAEGGALDCPPGEMQLPGADACTPLGSECGGRGAPTGAPEVTIFVDASAAPGGAGTRGSPFGTLAAALSAATMGDVVGVAGGTYVSAPLVVPAGVTVRGTCAAETTIDVDDASAPALRLTRDAAASDLTIRAAGTAVEVDGTGVSLSFVEIREATDGAVVVRSDASLAAARVAVRFPEEDAVRGVAVEVEDRGSADFAGLVIEDAMTYAMLVDGAGASVTAEDVAIRRTVPRSGRYGIAVEVRSAALALRRAAFEANAIGVWVKGADARVEIEHMAMVDAVPDPSGIAPGVIFDGGQLTVRKTLFEQMIMVAVQLQGAGQVTLSDVVCRDTQPVPAGFANELLLGTPISANHMGSGADVLDVSVQRASLEASKNAGLILSGVGLRAVFEDMTVLDTQHAPGDPKSGDGVFAVDGAQVTLRRALFRRTEQTALRSSDPGTLLELYDVAVTDMLGRESDGNLGYGSSFAGGATVRGERLSFERAREAAILVSSNATVALSDVTVDDVRSTASSTFMGFGIGYWAATGGDLTVERGRISRALALGAVCTADTVCRFSDLLVEATQSWERDSELPIALGHGVELQYGQMELTRVVLEGNRAVGLTALSGRVDVMDVVVRGTLPDAYEGAGGGGITALGGATIAGAFVEVDTNRQVGIAAYDVGTTITLSDARILSTDRAECAESTCAMNPGGVGVLATRGGGVSLERFEVATSNLAGLMIADDGEVDLRDGVVRNNPIGANVQTPGYDVGRLQDGVAFLDNETNLDAVSLPVPEPAVNVNVPDPEQEP